MPVIACSAPCSAWCRAGSPEINIQPVPSAQLAGAMNTGACTKRTPRASQRATRSAVGRTAVVVWSTTQAPAGSTPASGSSTASTEASSDSERWMRSAPCTACATVAQAVTPPAASLAASACALAALRFHARTVRPLARAR